MDVDFREDGSPIDKSQFVLIHNSCNTIAMVILKTPIASVVFPNVLGRAPFSISFITQSKGTKHLRNMICIISAIIGASLLASPAAAGANDGHPPAADVDALFHDQDAQLNANKQVVYHIVRDLLQAGHWELADRYLTERYIQHNPNITSGREAIVDAAINVWKAKAKPISEHIEGPIIAVVAERDLVIVVVPSVQTDPNDPSKTYTTTWFDMWRIQNGKADEHWDAATKGQ